MNSNTPYQPPTNYYNLNDTSQYQLPKLPNQNDINSTHTTYPDFNNPISNIQQQIQAQPIISNNQLNILHSNLNSINTALRSNPQYLQCPFCNLSSITRIEKSYSTTNLLCCLCFGAFAWLGLQAIRGKDLNCIDAEHYCGRCGNRLGLYQAC